jgi:phenylacetate-CoA ligase
MRVPSFIANLIFHLLPPGVMDSLANASLPNSDRSFKIFSKIKPSVFEYYSGKKMLFTFKKAARSVPAYKNFLQNHNINPSEINSTEDFDRLVPRTTKENYVKVYSLTERCVNGEFPHKGSFEESSGSSGTSTLWIRSLEEEKNNMALMKASLLHLYGFREEDKYIVLNCFLLGGWTGGLRFATRISTLASVRNIGPDPGKLINCLKELGTGFTFLIGAYPPFIVELIEFGKSLNDFSWKDYRINIFAGGEGFVEEWREYVSSQLKKGALIFSDYGAIDLDVGISVETPFTVALRKLFKNDAKLRNGILSSERTPCFIGQCSPQQYYVRETINKNGIKELEITVMNLKSVSPNIKYVIGDEGGIIRFQEICKILDKEGYPIAKIKHDFNIPAIIPFPIIYLYGRNDGTVSIDGALISPSEIYKAILSDPELVSAINTFKLSSESDRDNYIKLFIFLETRNEILITESLINKCNDIILTSLLNSNECFRISYSKNPDLHKPVINILPFNTGIFAERNSALKHVYTK